MLGWVLNTPLYFRPPPLFWSGRGNIFEGFVVTEVW